MAMIASKGPAFCCAGGLVRSTDDDESRSVALIPSAEEEVLAAWSWDAV